MIIFCEDCGARNEIPDEQGRDGNANFQCSACGYRNLFAIELHTDGRSKSFSQILERCVLEQPAIIGGFVYQADQKIQINVMPKSLKIQDLAILGHYLSDCWNTAADAIADIEVLCAEIGGKQISVEKNTHGLFLILFSTGEPIPDSVHLVLKPSFDNFIV